MKQLLEKTKSKTMQWAKSTYDQIIDDGIKIGMEKGIERGIEKGIELAILKAHKSGQTVEFTASMFEISVDKVKRVIEQHR